MNTNQQIVNSIRNSGLLPLYYTVNENASLAIAGALYAAGLKVMEYTNRGEFALENFKQLVKEKRNMPGVLLGVGTIKSGEEAKQFADAGADFLISPFFDESVLHATYDSSIFWIPGCMTPSEIKYASNNGCAVVKLFPANVVGPSFISNIKPVMPGIDFIVTGGVEPTEQNLTGWFASGAIAVGMGSNLISKRRVEEKNYTAIGQKAKEVLQIINSIKSQLSNDK
jgi:2-dehydro-3-deoxyphosphogluconate aldolase / (4S)-4-hydroxy-2-oxoglutarate aldolase